MTALILLLTFFIVMPVIALTGMSGIFLGGGMASGTDSYALADSIMWAGLLLAVLMAVLHVWGLVRHFRDVSPKSMTRALIWSPLPLCLIFFGAVFSITP